jgi:hypothetical protein
LRQDARNALKKRQIGIAAAPNLAGGPVANRLSRKARISGRRKRVIEKLATLAW